MRTSSLFNPVIRATVIIGLALAMLSGVTYAALQSHSKFNASSIMTAVANLQVSRDNVTFTNTQTDLNFNNLIPGGSLTPSAGYPIYLKDAGATPLSLKLSVGSTPTNPNGVDLTKVNMVLTSTTNSQVQTFTLQALIDAYATGGVPITITPVIFPGQILPFTVQASMASDAFSGTSATIGSIDYVFTGVAVN